MAVQSSQSLAGARVSSAGEVYASLSSAILSGTFSPGQRLYETVLAKEYGVSRTPVREALRTLISEGLAVATPTGAAVTELTIKDVHDLLQASEALQRFTCRLAAENGVEAQVERLNEIMVEMAQATQEQIPQWTAADKDLHEQIAIMANNRVLARLVGQVEAMHSRVRHLAIRLPNRLPESNAEHRRIVEAIRRHDPDAAEEAMAAHLQTVHTLLIHVLETFIVPLKGERF